MGLINNVAEVIDLVGKTIKNTREIVAAFKDASAYLHKRYPHAPRDLGGLLTEMRTTLVGLARVTDVITGFRFYVDAAGLDLDLGRFNNMVIDRKSRLVELRNSISSLKGSSGKMRDYATDLASSDGRPVWQLFDIMGLAKKKADELGHQFDDLYVVDQKMVYMLQQLMDATETALQDVSNALGPAGFAEPRNVPVAAVKLGDYAKDS